MKPGAKLKKFTPLVGGKKPTKFKPPLLGSTFSSTPNPTRLSEGAFTTPFSGNENEGARGKEVSLTKSAKGALTATTKQKSKPLQDHATPDSAFSCDVDDEAPLDAASQERKKVNARALMSGNIKVERKPFMANGILGTAGFKRFKPPGDPGTYTKSLTKKLGGGVFNGKGFLQSKFSSGAVIQRTPAPKLRLSVSVSSVLSSDGESSSDDDSDDGEGDKPEFLPHEPLAVWEPSPDEAADGCVPIMVPTVLAQFLRPHQRAGVSFCTECLLGNRDFDGTGCILADDMGLGKTLQSITTLYTMMRAGKRGPDEPLVRRAIVVCPCSLVNNWGQEFEKWINCRVKTDAEKVRALAMSATDKKSVTFAIAQFLHVSRPYDVLVISYETFRMYVSKFTKKNDSCCDLLICDEAHRLKNPDALTTKALASLACRKRILLSGTPVQNDLDEFFAMADFTNPGVLGTSEEFRRTYKNPILVGREPGASQQEQDRAKVLQNEMSGIVNQFILRRTNTINAKFLPDKLVQVVCCKLTDTQVNLYRHLVASKDVQAALNGKVKDALSYIQNLQKLCNHPKILELSCGGKTKGVTKEELSLFGVPLDSADHDEASKNNIHPALSGKMMVLHNLMDVMWRDQTPKKPPDKIVVISIYTQTLDLVERMCKGRKWPVVRLDGSLAVKKRMELVNAFNDEKNRNAFCFLLSSKAGGCGINLIGANRLVLFDSDWNPATDKQAAARCWRDGQKKQCYTYRFLSAGTLEEKIFQRQLSKEGLAAVIEDKEQVNALSANDLKALFKFRENTPSDTHDKLKCKHCRLALEAEEEGDDAPLGAAQVAFLNEILEWLRALPESQHFLGGQASLVAASSGSGDGSGGGGVGAQENKMSDDSISSAACSSSSSSAAASRKPAGKSKVKMSDLHAINEKLHSGGFSKLTEFHRDVRQMCSAARKLFEPGTLQYNDAEPLKELFDERWAAASAEIATLSSGGNARVFTEEELAGAAATIQSAAMSGSAQQGRPARQKFNMPGKAKPMALLKPGGVAAKSSFSACSSSSSSSGPSGESEIDGSAAPAEKKRSSLSLAPHKKQHEMPKEEDLNNWSHHFSVDTIEDAYLKQATANTDLVSFVFGLKVTWELTQAQTALDEERETLDKERRDADLEDAKGRLDAKKTKKKKAKEDVAVEEEAGEGMEQLGEEASSLENVPQESHLADDEALFGGINSKTAHDEGEEGALEPSTTPNRVSGASEAKRVSAAHEDERNDAGGGGSQISCPLCTLLNPRGAKKCSACSTTIVVAPKKSRKKREQDSLQALSEQPVKKGKKSRNKKPAPPEGDGQGHEFEQSECGQDERPAKKKKKKKAAQDTSSGAAAQDVSGFDLATQLPEDSVVEVVDESPERAPTSYSSQESDGDFG